MNGLNILFGIIIIINYLIPLLIIVLVGWWIYSKVKKNEQLKEEILEELKKQNENKE